MQWLSSDHVVTPDRHESNNRRAVGSGVFYAVHADLHNEEKSPYSLEHPVWRRVRIPPP
jgi:hypothetical protein